MQFITAGKYTYGMEKIKVFWGGRNHVHIGSFCSIGSNISMYLGNGASHHQDYLTTYPFGQIQYNSRNRSYIQRKYLYR